MALENDAPYSLYECLRVADEYRHQHIIDWITSNFLLINSFLFISLPFYLFH